MQDLSSCTLVPLCCCLPEQLQYRTPGTLVSSLKRYIGNGLGGRGNNGSTGRRVIDLERVGVQWTGGLLTRGFHVICIITYLSGMSSLSRGTLPLLHCMKLTSFSMFKAAIPSEQMFKRPFGDGQFEVMCVIKSSAIIGSIPN